MTDDERIISAEKIVDEQEEKILVQSTMIKQLKKELNQARTEGISFTGAINTTQCPPVEMRKNLVLVDAFRKGMIDFVPIPVMNTTDRESLLDAMYTRLDTLETEANK